MALTRIYVDKTALDRNKEDGKNRPPFIVVCDGKETPAYRVKIIGECELIYDPHDSPLPGISAYLEISGEVTVLSRSDVARMIQPTSENNLTGENEDDFN